MALSSDNKLDFVPVAAEQGLMAPFDVRALGAVFAIPGAQEGSTLKLGGRAAFSLRQGFDPIDASSTGRVVEGGSDVGVTLRKGSTALSLFAQGLAYRAGLDNPLAAAGQGTGEGSAPALKVSVAKELGEDAFAALAFDLTQRKPEFTLGWAGTGFTEQGSVVLHADPLLRTYKIAAAVAFPGLEWRQTVLDRGSATVRVPKDDGARHRLWAQHTIKDKQWGYSTRVGAAFDLGRLLNYAADFVDLQVEPRIPPLVWRVPLLHRLYTFLVPDQDAEQFRYRLKGLDLEASHEFGRQGAQLGLAKHWSSASVRAGWHTGAQEASLQYSRRGIGLTARLGRHEGGGSWGAPSLMLHVEPLGLL